MGWVHYYFWCNSYLSYCRKNRWGFFHSIVYLKKKLRETRVRMDLTLYRVHKLFTWFSWRPRTINLTYYSHLNPFTPKLGITWSRSELPMNRFFPSGCLWCWRECQSASHLSPRQIPWVQDGTSVRGSRAMVGASISVRARADIFQEPVPKYNLPLCQTPPTTPQLPWSRHFSSHYHAQDKTRPLISWRWFFLSEHVSLRKAPCIV